MCLYFRGRPQDDIVERLFVEKQSAYHVVLCLLYEGNIPPVVIIFLKPDILLNIEQRGCKNALLLRFECDLPQTIIPNESGYQ